MNRRARWIVTGILGIGVAMCVLACTDWFSAPGVPTLIIGAVTIADGRGEIVLSVANMPGGGLASMLAAVGGVVIAPGWVSNVAVEGVNGFEVLASKMQGGGSGFVVCHPSSGLEEGAFVKLTFRVWRDVTLADCAFDVSRIELGDARDNPIQFELTDEFTYYQPTRRTR